MPLYVQMARTFMWHAMWGPGAGLVGTVQKGEDLVAAQVSDWKLGKPLFGESFVSFHESHVRECVW